MNNLGVNEGYMSSQQNTNDAQNSEYRKPCDPKPDNPERPRPSGEPLNPCRVRPATPYLIIRSWADDLGVRPIPVNDSASLYYSPDIPFVPETFDDGSFVLQAWITNAGLAPAAPVQVEFYLIPPNLTFLPSSPMLVATEYTVIQPQSSALVVSRRLTLPNPFGGGLARGVVVRCSTPFDTHMNSLDPRLDRHVAIMNAWPITDAVPQPIDLKITNWFTATTTSTVEMVIERLQVASDYKRSRSTLKIHDLSDDLLHFGESLPSIEQHLELLKTERRIRPKFARKLQRAIRRRPCSRVSSLRHSSVALIPSQIQVEVELKSGSCRLYPTAASLRHRLELFPGAGTQTLACLPSPRQILIESLRLEPLEEREIKVQFGGFGELRSDEFIVVQLFHINREPQDLLGCFSFVVASEDSDFWQIPHSICKV